MMLPTRIAAPIAALIALLMGASCQPDRFSSNPSLRLGFSADTVMFDTVFCTVGTATKTLKIYNRSSAHLRIDRVQLRGGAGSPYSVNLDGIDGHSFSDIALRAYDSLFLFVRLSAPPTAQDTPLCVADSLLFITNGNRQQVQLLAWGQDVALHRNAQLNADTALRAGRPHLVYGTMTVEAGARLTLEAGARLHFHPRASLVVRGALLAEGTAEAPVVLTGDRLEPYYRDKAGQWGGIHLQPGSTASLRWARVRNCITALRADALADTLRLSHCRMERCSHACLLANGTSVVADNCLFANGANACVSLLGGEHRLSHCTVACYWSGFSFRGGAALQLHHPDTLPMVRALFENCIVYGTRPNEVEATPPSAPYLFRCCLLRTSFDTSDARMASIALDDPKFINTAKLNLELDTLSPAIGRACPAVAQRYPIDLNGNPRLDDGWPDIGAFERQ